uniref:Myb/SANT-like DNA-binding domain-containing protein n=1 Tax=Scleropages formosus TaxID=113540 RepID=A0A8C9THX9_SCLFO
MREGAPGEDDGDWKEEEVRALLAVWSEKDVQYCMRGAGRNKAIFIYMSNRLHRLGISRDWRQVLAKCASLKSQYHSVKFAHSTGNPSTPMKYFQDLDSIMACESGGGPQDDDEDDDDEGEGQEEELDEERGGGPFVCWAPDGPQEGDGSSAGEPRREGNQAKGR